MRKTRDNINSFFILMVKIIGFILMTPVLFVMVRLLMDMYRQDKRGFFEMMKFASIMIAAGIGYVLVLTSK